MTIGMTSYVYRWSIGTKDYSPPVPLNALEVVRRAARLGFGSVQLCDHLNLGLSLEEVDLLRTALSENRMAAELGSSSSEPEYLRKMITLAEQIGASLVRVVPAIQRQSRYESIEDQLDSEVNRFRQTLAMTGGQGVTIALENHAGLLGAELRQLVESIDSDRVGVCLDTMNSVALLERPEETVEILGPLAVTVHLKDFRVVQGPLRHTVEGTPLGEGVVPFGSLLAQLRRNRQISSYHIEHYLDRSDADGELLAWEEDSLARSMSFAIEHLGFRRNRTGG